MASAPPFDPSKPFDVVPSAAAAPPFDPSKPFEAVSAPPFDPSKPFETVQPAAAAALPTLDEPSDPFATLARATGAEETGEHLVHGLKTVGRGFTVDKPAEDEGFFSPSAVGRGLARPLKIIEGIFETATAPVTGPIEHAEKGIESATGGFIRPQDIDKALMAVPGSPAGRGAMGAASFIDRLFHEARTGEKAAGRFAKELSNEMFSMKQAQTADRAELTEKVKQAPPEFLNQQAQERTYANIEAQQPHHPADQRGVDQVLQPLRDEHDARYNRLRNAGYPATDISDPRYMHRRAVGHQMDLERDDPILGRTRQLARTMSAFRERKMLGGEEVGGTNRIVVSQDRDGNFRVHTPGQRHSTPANIVAPDVIEHQGRHYNIGQATTAEIEAATAASKEPVKYYKNALANTVNVVERGRAIERNVNFLDRLMARPEWAKMATRDAKTAEKKGWKTTNLPQLQGWHMQPKLANAFNDFYEPGSGSGALLNALRKVNQFATGSMFWQPTPHALNVMNHWIVGRGWDWIRPKQIKALFWEGSRAIRAVTTQNADYRRLLREGSGMLYGSVKNADFYRNVAKLTGMDIQRNPARWDPIARAFGVGPSDLIRMVYEGSSKVLWWANDVFMMQRVLELERKGMSTAKAIEEAEKHIPPYRVPPEVFNSRAVSQAVQDPAFLIFGRYHYGQLSSYANMVKDLGTGSREQKFEAMGNLLALGILTYVVYPFIYDNVAKLITGDSDAKARRAGPSTIPHALDDLYDGKKNVWQVIGDTITPSLTGRLLGSTFGGGHDPFTGKPITEPGSEGGAQAAQWGDWLMGQLMQPYQLSTQKGEEEGGRTPFQKVRDSVLGLQNVSPATQHGQTQATRAQQRAAIKREAHPRGWLESLFYTYKGSGEGEGH